MNKATFIAGPSIETMNLIKQAPEPGVVQRLPSDELLVRRAKKAVKRAHSAQGWELRPEQAK